MAGLAQRTSLPPLRGLCEAVTVTCRERSRADAWAAHCETWQGPFSARLIPLVRTLAEIFDIVLWAAMDCKLRPLPPPILGFCPGRQPLEIAGCISVALAKAAEWEEPLCAATMDLSSALNPLAPALVAEALWPTWRRSTFT